MAIVNLKAVSLVQCPVCVYSGRTKEIQYNAAEVFFLCENCFISYKFCTSNGRAFYAFNE